MPTDPHHALRMLDWDSRHFGCPVASITDANLDDIALVGALEAARLQEARIVYWHAPASRQPDPQILERYGGQLGDHKTTYSWQATGAENLPADADIGEWPRGPASAELRELAREAGTLSRFRRDERFPQDRSITLYEIWIERSCRGEMADAVLVAKAEGTILGMATIAIREEHAARTGQIGLIAVAQSARGQGWGLRLMHAVQRWLLEREIQACTVITQRVNTAACQLYQRAGFALAKVESVWHFVGFVKR